ncbi:integral membrane protein [Streptomyces davaonensis JCM 4913]|uniref:Integral membrane protein n=1 Tax=Streptomyces davaonensis (strain DSM 101723 / JCM 4913 / KCC S-0913 / 768) TaxID=1214101 RepID=K4QZ70_STRDJ|nr:hypothetical protein [Streptomyces davaonensis]CCK26353.1 integral membrane protein [Streptomyces davaonensis JCM 4913]
MAGDAEAPDGSQAELERLRARIAALEAEKETRPKRHWVRSTLAVVLIVLGCILAPLGAVAAWTADLAGDTDRYVDTVEPLAKDRDIQNAVANRVTDAVMDRLDVPALISQTPVADRPLVEKALGRLGPSLQNAVRSFVHDKAQAVVASDAFETIWTEANRRAHDAVVKALTGEGGGAVKVENDTVTLDLGPVVERVKDRLVDEGMTVAGKIPEIHTSITLVQSEDIGRARTGFRLLELVGFWLPVISIVLIAGGVFLATHRRKALVAGALGFAFAVGLLGIALTIFRTVYLDALPSGVSQPAAESIYDTLVRFLRTSVRVAVVLGVVVALAAWLTGPGRRARFVRQMWHSGIGAVRSTADRAGLRTGRVGHYVHRHRGWISWLLVAAAVLAFVLWPYPTGAVVLGLALALLFALAVVDFVAEDESAAKDGAVST